MKKFTMCLVGAMLVLSLAACTPTTEKQAQTAETMETAETGGASDKIPDPNAPVVVKISVYSPNKDASGLDKAMDDVETLDAQAVVDKLVEYGVLEQGTIALGFQIEGKKDGSAGPGAGSDSAAEVAELGTLDLTKVPEAASSDGLTLVAIANTFIENFNLEKVKILIKGEAYTGGEGDGIMTYNAGYETLK